MYTFPKIKSWKHVCHHVNGRAGSLTAEPIKVVDYIGTTKLHGTNAGIECTRDELRAQSRVRPLEAGSKNTDNMGFAAFVANNRKQIREIEAVIRGDHVGTLVIFGEWIGQGIGHPVAVSKLTHRAWVIFAAAKIVDGHRVWLEVPEIGTWPMPDDDYVWSAFDRGQVYHATVDFTDPISVATFFNDSAAEVEEIDAQCPVGAACGVEGPGEGIVWVPADPQLRQNTDLWWKHKGGSHVGSKRPMKKVDVEKLSKIDILVEGLLADRLEEGIDYLAEMGLPLMPKSIPAFLARVSGEVKEECNLEIEEAGFTWRGVAKRVNSKAVIWFKARIEEKIARESP